MSKDSKEVRARHAASIGKAFLGRGNSQCKGPKVSIFTRFTVFFIQGEWHSTHGEDIVFHFLGLGERDTFSQLSIQGS